MLRSNVGAAVQSIACGTFIQHLSETLLAVQLILHDISICTRNYIIEIYKGLDCMFRPIKLSSREWDEISVEH